MKVGVKFATERASAVKLWKFYSMEVPGRNSV